MAPILVVLRQGGVVVLGVLFVLRLGDRLVLLRFLLLLCLCRRIRLVVFNELLVCPRELVDEAADLLSIGDVAVVEPVLEAAGAEVVLDAGLGDVHGGARGQYDAKAFCL